MREKCVADEETKGAYLSPYLEYYSMILSNPLPLFSINFNSENVEEMTSFLLLGGIDDKSFSLF